MSTPTGDEFEIEFEVEVEAELDLAEASEPGAAGQPASEWLFDPTDVEREEVELRNLLGAAEELESGPRSRRRGTGEGA
ncbi:hypothetical protein GCM10009527_053370 [Actinomadura nitritigenes]|uniref:Uncharacterized protein n=1 Tax=Actinomadura nitritigenes TaxID=134602 RepID=A0ABS3RBQ8_9ACTN|nr:hypothetical protein [Actinomadura nitritigenes]MBO2443048.1 hypothetical protein [Actinomadura nitritigenes]